MMSLWCQTPDSPSMSFEVGSLGFAWTRYRVMQNPVDGTWSSTIGGSDGEPPVPVDTLDQLQYLIGNLTWQVRESRGVLVAESPDRSQSYLFPAESWPVLQIIANAEDERVRDDVQDVG